MNRKGIITLLGVTAVSASALAAPLKPSEALVRMADAAGEMSSLRMKAPAGSEPKLVYTAKAEGMNDPAFYVFNNSENGFVILSADDRLPAVLGFSDNGAFDYDRISPEMKWWLGEYQKDIAGMYSDEGIGVPAIATSYKKAVTTERKAIEPMLTTRWNQMAPYNQLCPRQYPTGCVATAMAQVMKYHEWPLEPTGSSGGETFDGTVYDWENMIDDYEHSRYTVQEAEAVAVLMRQCGASVNMMYSPYASGAYSFDVPVALYTYFGYDEGMRLEYRDYYKMSEWNDLVYAELEGNRPVYYSGASSAGGHAFVCDGYLGNNYFHFNWGWGGYQDGYFLLNALNPGVGGTGSFAGGYNMRQAILTGVKKSEGPAVRQKMLLSTGSFMYDSGASAFGVSEDSEGYNMFYNPLGYVISGKMGLKVTPMDGGEAKYFQGPTSVSLQPGYGTKNFQCTVSGLADGKYKAVPALYADGEWWPVMVVVGTQPYVTVTVDGGKVTYSNDGLPADEMPLLLAGIPRTMPTVYGDGAKVFRATVLNVSGGDYNNYLTLSLYEQGKGGAGAVRETSNFVTIPGNSALDVDFVIDSSNPASTYELYLMDNSGKYLVSNGEGDMVSDNIVKIVDSGRDISSNARMVFSGISPNFWTLGSDGGIGLMMTVKNNYFAQVEQSFYVKLMNTSFKDVHSFGPFSLTLDSGVEQIVNFRSEELDLEAGYYYWQVVDAQGNNLSRLYALMVTSETREKEGIYYQVTSESGKRARLVSPTMGEYEGEVKVPSHIDGYYIDELRDDAFTFASEMTSVSLPFGIGRIDKGSFYKATSLQEFTMARQTPPTFYSEAFAPGLQENIKFNTYFGYANLYANSPGWSDFLFSSWTIKLGEGVEIDSENMEIDPLTGTLYNPYYVCANQSPAFTLKSDDPEMGFRAIITIDGEETTQDFWRQIWLPVLDGRSGEVEFVAVPGLKVDEIEKAKTVTVFSVDGTLLLNGAYPETLKTLPRGLYIVNGRKVAL